MSDSDIEIVDEKPLETVILLDSDSESEDFTHKADERQDVIELDEPLGKSSNIPSPRTDDLDDDYEAPVGDVKLNDRTADNVRDEEKSNQEESGAQSQQPIPEGSIGAIDRVKKNADVEKEYWLSLSSEPNSDNERNGDEKPVSQSEKIDTTKKEEPQVVKADTDIIGKTFEPTKLENQDSKAATNHVGSPVSSIYETAEEGTSNVHSPLKKIHDKSPLSSPLKPAIDAIPSEGNAIPEVKADEQVNPSPAEPSTQKDCTKLDQPPLPSQTSSLGGNISNPIALQIPTQTIQPSLSTQSTVLTENDENESPKLKQQSSNDKIANVSNEVPPTQTKPPKPLPYTKPASKEVPKFTRPSLEDDFFSMSHSPPIIEPKKKKKKKLKRKLSEEPTSTISETSGTATPPTQPTTTTVGISSSTSQVPTQIGNDVGKSEETPKKKKRIGRPLTPPPLDEKAFKEAFAAKMNSINSYSKSYDPMDAMFEEDDRYKDKLAQLEKMRQSFELEKPKSDSNSREASEEPSTSGTKTKSRKYILHITSFLPGSQNSALDIDVKGDKKFHAVITKTLNYLLGLGTIPDSHKSIYRRADQITLFWDKMRIQDFMRPDSLNLPEPENGEPTSIELGLYTKGQAFDIERFRKLEREEKYRKLAQREAMDAEAERLEREEKEREERERQQLDKVDEDPFKDDELFKSIESRETTLQPSNVNEDEGEFFKIGLKGEDNKKIIVKVHAGTQISKLVEHFISKKGLPPTTQLKLVFDDEDIDLDGTVGDTELEEDFTVDVLVTKK